MTDIFIIEESFLIRSALIKLIHDIDLQKRVFEMNSPAELSEFHLNRDNAIIIINEGLLTNNFDKEFRKLELQNFKILKICLNKESESRHDEVIYLDEKPFSILTKLKKLFASQKRKQTKENGTKILSGRETDILKFVALGLTNKEIADKLFLSAHTVITHRKNISAKLGIKTIAGFTVYALLNNIIFPNDSNTN